MREVLHEAGAVTLRILLPEDGPRALLVHGLRADAPADDGTLAYDRRGHGGSPAPQPYTGTTVEEQAEDAVRVLDAVGAPPLPVTGRDLGGLIALDLARRHPARVTALTLVDVVLPQLVADGAEYLAAVLPDAPVPADVAALTSWAVTRGELRAIAVPVRIVVNDGAPPQAHVTADVLSGLLPRAAR